MVVAKSFYPNKLSNRLMIATKSYHITQDNQNLKLEVMAKSKMKMKNNQQFTTKEILIHKLMDKRILM